jgi:hypothetical protein
MYSIFQEDDFLPASMTDHPQSKIWGIDGLLKEQQNGSSENYVLRQHPH